VTSFDDEMKKLYPPPGQEMSAEGKAMLERMKVERAERNKDIATLIDEQGRLTADGRARLRELENALMLVIHGHDDNTGAWCRIDLDGHDCCYTCNAAEDMLRATAKYYEDA